MLIYRFYWRIVPFYCLPDITIYHERFWNECVFDFIRLQSKLVTPNFNMYCMYSRFIPNTKSVSGRYLCMYYSNDDINITKRFYGHENIVLEYNLVTVDTNSNFQILCASRRCANSYICAQIEN